MAPPKKQCDYQRAEPCRDVYDQTSGQVDSFSRAGFEQPSVTYVLPGMSIKL